MKRIVRLTESDLTKIVRRVIRESKRSLLREGNGAAVADSFIKSLSGLFDDDEAGALNNIRLLKDKTALGEFANRIQSVKGMTFCEYLNDEMSNVDEEYELIIKHIKSIGGADCFNYSWWNTLMIAVKDKDTNRY
jgi:replication-associated recombination protein RarA